MVDKILIFGKDTWPYTIRAREAYAKKGAEVKYVNVKADAKNMEAMLEYSDGIRKVPVIVEHDNIIIGFNGGTWRVWVVGCMSIRFLAICYHYFGCSNVSGWEGLI